MIKEIKILHTIIWFIMASATLYIFYAGITNTFNYIVLVSIILMSLEIVVLVYNKWTCPLTPIARKYTTDTKDNFDIYLPNWLARYNKIIFGSIFIIGMVLVIFNYFR